MAEGDLEAHCATLNLGVWLAAERRCLFLPFWDLSLVGNTAYPTYEDAADGYCQVYSGDHTVGRLAKVNTAASFDYFDRLGPYNQLNYYMVRSEDLTPLSLRMMKYPD